MSIVADVVAVLSVRFVKISTSASFESWQFLSATVLLKLIKIRFKELQSFAKVVKSDVIAVVIKAGMKFSEKQPVNISDIFVTFAVLNSGTDCSE